jgi:cellulase/cellobiase CelA1
MTDLVRLLHSGIHYDRILANRHAIAHKNSTLQMTFNDLAAAVVESNQGLVRDQRAVETLLSTDGVITWLRLDYPVAGEGGESQLMPLIWRGKPQAEKTFSGSLWASAASSGAHPTILGFDALSFPTGLLFYRSPFSAPT